MLNIKALLSRFLTTPIIIEQGTNGIWTYRKWSDGTAECWGAVSGPWTVSFTQIVAGTYSHSDWNGKSQALPSGLFKSITYGNVSATTTGYSSTQVAGININNIIFRVWTSYATSGLSISAYFLEVKGTWK